MDALNLRIKQAEAKIDQLEIESAREKVEADLVRKNVLNFKFCTVPHDYYDGPLEQRAKTLGANSVSQLCKTIVFENVAHQSDFSYSDITDSRYYCVVVQYEAKIDLELVTKLIISLREPGKDRLNKKKFNFQLAPEDVSDKLTGFIHNGVSPFGMKTPLPIIVCERCVQVEPSVLWMGGGHPNLKLCLSISDFLKSTNAVHGIEVSDRR